ncbi:MAG: DUF4097 family beta strand repeat-containing protein [Dehalococcoidia bacterium]|jgi:hypothetical protein
MAKMKRTWPANAFDATGVRARDSKVTIEGIDSDCVNLEGDHEENLRLEIVDRQLQIQTSERKDKAEFTLQLPKHKAWAVDLFSGQAEFMAGNIQARLNFILGKGEIHVENCSGALSVAAGKGNIHLEHFTETAIAELPRSTREWSLINLSKQESWPDWGMDFWHQAGRELGISVLKRFFKQSGDNEENAGINLQIGKGDLQLEDITVSEFIVRCGMGDVKLKGGRLTDFDLNLIKGNFICESCMPAGNWAIIVNRGDIRLSLPADTRARLDVATRQGDIKSTTPMVRVTRQGPEAWHGGRMVGTMGTNLEGTMPEIHLNTLHGDITIDTRRTAGLHYENQRTGQAPSYVPADGKAVPYNTPLAVLNALSEGRISAEEADRLLRNLNS